MFNDQEATQLRDTSNLSGCQYDECHNYAETFEGDENKDLSAIYCNEHAGPVTDEYADVSVIWDGAVDSFETVRTREELLKIDNETRDEVKACILSNGMPYEIPKDENGGVQVLASYHTHEFDTREEMDEFDGDCWCESFETLFDSTKECAVCGEDRKDRNGDEHRCMRYECAYKDESPVCEGMTDNADGLCDACDASNAEATL